MYPINLNFVKPKEIYAAEIENGEPTKLTVLVLDEAANESYWKRFSCFSKQLESLEIKSPDQAVSWHISSSFLSSLAMNDVLNFAVEQLLDIPISVIEDDRDFVVLELPDNKLEENNFWK